MDKRFLATVGIIIAVFVGFLIVSGGEKADAPETKAAPTEHKKGSEQPKVVITEYGDFQCPACAQYYPVIEQVHEKYKDQIAFQFRHFPLTAIHPNAFAGSRAAEAASKQDKFWEMYSQLYTNQSEWASSNTPSKVFEQYAKTLGLDVAKFKTDFASSAVNDSVQADIKAGEKLEVASTPTFVVDGKVLQKNPNPTLEAFSEIIDKAIAAKKQ